jgi:predicted neutral ceramidase superfamily lipid hydrolase
MTHADWIAVIAGVVAIAVVLGTDGLRASVLIAFPVVATALFCLLYVTLGVILPSWQAGVALAVVVILMWKTVWRSYRVQMPSVAMPYLQTVVASSSWVLGRLRWRRSVPAGRES